MLSFKNFWQWRDVGYEFVDQNGSIEKTRFMSLKRELLKLYTDLARQSFEMIDKKMGMTF